MGIRKRQGMRALALLVEEMRQIKKCIEGIQKREGRPLAYNYEDAGKMLGGMSAKTIYRMVKGGQLLPVRGEGRTRLIATFELERWIHENTEKPLHRKGGGKPKEAPRSPKDEAQRARELLKRR